MYPAATRPGFNIWQIISIVFVIAAIVLVAYFAMKRAETPFTQAVSLIRAGKAAAALPILEDLTKKQPDNSAVLPWLAQGYLSTDRLAEGRTALDTALRLKLPSETMVPVVLAYAKYYQAKGDFDEAERLFDSAQSACEGRQLNEGRAFLYVQWAEADAESSKLNNAVEHMEKARLLAADVEEPVKGRIPHMLARYYRELAGIAEVKTKDDTAAIELLEKSLAAADEPATRMALANIYAREKKADQAIHNYMLVTQADPNNLEARHRLVDMLIAKKDTAKAQEALIELIDKERSIENYQLLVSLDLQLGNYAGAVRALEDAINLRENDPILLAQLEKTLRDWSGILKRQGKFDEAMSVDGHACRVQDMLAMLTKKEEKVEETEETEEKSIELAAALPEWDPAKPPIALSASRIWLAKGSLTPEGEIRIRNITGRPVQDLALTVVFYDNTSKQRNGVVSLPVASSTSPPFSADGQRSLYFSCPNIVKADHQLAVIILWKGKFLRELPVVKG